MDELSLRSAYERAIDILRTTDQDAVLITNRVDGVVNSAVAVVVGSVPTDELTRMINAVFNTWDQNRRRRGRGK